MFSGGPSGRAWSVC